MLKNMLFVVVFLCGVKKIEAGEFSDYFRLEPVNNATPELVLESVKNTTPELVPEPVNNAASEDIHCLPIIVVPQILRLARPKGRLDNFPFFTVNLKLKGDEMIPLSRIEAEITLVCEKKGFIVDSCFLVEELGLQWNALKVLMSPIPGADK